MYQQGGGKQLLFFTIFRSDLLNNWNINVLNVHTEPDEQRIEILKSLFSFSISI